MPAALEFIKCHPFTALAVLVLLVVSPHFLLKVHTEWDEVYLAASRDMTSGHLLYPPRNGFVYPPFIAWILIPFSQLAPFSARVIWYAVNVGCIFLFVRWSWQLSGGKRLEVTAAPDRREPTIAVLGLLCGWPFIFNAFSHHQTDLVIGTLMMAGCLFLGQSRPLRAAVCLGLAAAMKGPAMLWCPYLAWRRQWKAAVGMLTVAVGLNLLPNLFITPPGGGWWLRDWVKYVSLPMRRRDLQPGMWFSDMMVNQSLGGAIGRWFTTKLTWTDGGVRMIARPHILSPGVLKFALAAGMVLLLGGTMLAQGTRPLPFSGNRDDTPSPAALEFSMVLMLMLLLSPMSSKAHFGTLILPGFCLARLLVRKPDQVLGALFAAALLAELFSLRLLGNWGGVGLWLGSLSCVTLLHLIACGYAFRTQTAASTP
jgi:hypothetical protein